MSQKTICVGRYSPLKRRPGVPPSEFFKETRNPVTKSMKPKELAAINYAYLDGRSNSQMKPQNREPQ